MSVSKLIVPKDILDVLLCDNCHKYLSAKPVKMGDGKILCGRCLNEENVEYVNSQYEIFAEHALFNCINHFNGCRQLLSYDQVIEHEKHCKSENFECKLCLSDVPTYMLPYHVKTNHNKSFLKKNYFIVELIHLKMNVFFYKTDSYLFFIEQFFNNNNKSISLNVIGVCNKKLHINFCVKSQGDGDIHFESQTWPLNFDTKCNNSKKYYIVVKNVKNCEVVKIYFDVEVPTLTQYMQIDSQSKETITETGALVNLEHIKFENSENSNLESLIIRKLSLLNKITNVCPLSRRINLDPTRCFSYGVSCVSISPCETKLIVNQLDVTFSICFHCFLCENVLNQARHNFINKNGPLRHLICFWCQYLVKDFIELMLLSEILSDEVFTSLKFTCNRRCQTFDCCHLFSTHSTHTFLINQSCCIDNCTFKADNVSSMFNHFLNTHNKLLHIQFIDNSIIVDIFKYSETPFYIWYNNLFIEVAIEKQRNDENNLIQEIFFISAKFSNKIETNLTLAMHVIKILENLNLEYVDTFFKTQIKIEAAKKGDELYLRCFTL